MPEIGGKRYNTMNDINITLNGVTKLLKDLKDGPINFQGMVFF